MNLFPMTHDQYEAYLKSPKWRVLRMKVFKRDGYKCLECSTKYNLQAHHLTYDNIGEEKIEQLITLCRKCHEKQHKGALLIKVIKACCEQFLSQRPSEDYNPRRHPRCHGCGWIFSDFKEIRYHYGTNAFGSPGVYCGSCIRGVRECLRKSKAPHLINEIHEYDPTDKSVEIIYEDENGKIVKEFLS